MFKSEKMEERVGKLERTMYGYVYSIVDRGVEGKVKELTRKVESLEAELEALKQFLGVQLHYVNAHVKFVKTPKQ